MTLTKPIKILVGVLTLLIIVVPFLLIPLVWGFSMLTGLVLAAQPERVEVPLMVVVMFFAMPLFMLYPFVQLALQVFYIIHEVKNKFLTDTPRILFILGSYFMPFIALPLYFVMHIWRDGPKPAVEAPAPGTAG